MQQACENQDLLQIFYEELPFDQFFHPLKAGQDAPDQTSTPLQCKF
jgi:hypothetical protein